MGTASKFRHNAGGIATTAGSLHPVHEHCIHIQGSFGGTAITAGSVHPPSWALHSLSKQSASTWWDTASTSGEIHIHGKHRRALQPLQLHCIQLKWHCTLTVIPAGSMHPPSWALHPPSQHASCTLWDTASTAWALQQHSRTMHQAMKSMQGHCIPQCPCRDTAYR